MHYVSHQSAVLGSLTFRRRAPRTFNFSVGLIGAPGHAEEPKRAKRTFSLNTNGKKSFFRQQEEVHADYTENKFFLQHFGNFSHTSGAKFFFGFNVSGAHSHKQLCLYFFSLLMCFESGWWCCAKSSSLVPCNRCSGRWQGGSGPLSSSRPPTSTSFLLAVNAILRLSVLGIHAGTLPFDCISRLSSRELIFRLVLLRKLVLFTFLARFTSKKTIRGPRTSSMKRLKIELFANQLRHIII